MLRAWIGLPKVERIESSGGSSEVVKAQWMEVRIEVYKPDEISDDELARSNTIQKSVSSFTRSFTLTGRKKEKKEEEKEEAAAGGGEEDDDEEDEAADAVEP